MHAVETNALSHCFSPDAEVLRDVDLQVPLGSIYGFLGPNGAGKTTTLRLLIGLLRRQRGSIRLFGLALEPHRLALLRRIGSAIESPSLYVHLTAAENLAVWRAIYECPSRRIDEVLRLVGLSDTGSKRVSQFSLGMKQRLSLAIALLHEPALLILDEPTNGLDPHGIIEMRDLLLRLNREQGTTIVVSSHLLSEVERLATHVGIISRGELVFQGSLAALVNVGQAGVSIRLDTSDNARALALITAGGWTGRLEQGRLVVSSLSSLSSGEVARMNAHLVASGIGVYSIVGGTRDLEQVFLDLVQSGRRS